MLILTETPAVAVARRHVEAWDNHDDDAARAGLANDVHVTAMSVDPKLPVTDTTGVDRYMQGPMKFTQAVVPGSSPVNISLGDENLAAPDDVAGEVRTSRARAAAAWSATLPFRRG
jgi:hypothetical protein